MTLQRTESFVPLTTLPASGEHQEFRITVIPKTGQTRSLQSLEPTPPVPLEGAAGTGKMGEPQVSLQYEGDRITHIRIQCACGQILDLACVYEPASKPA
jgi:hypothetical protein